MRFLICLILCFIIISPAKAQDDTIKIGELLCYTGCPETAKFWRNGWTIALEEINANGGVLGKKLEVISRDTRGNPADAIQVLSELKDRENIKLIMGTLYDHVNLATIDFAKRNHILHLRGFGGTNKATGEHGHDRYFQLEPPIRVWTGPLADEAARKKIKKWAFVSADYEFGRSLVEQFQKDLKARLPDAEFIETQWFPIGKLNAGLVSQTIARSKPDGIFAVVFEGDYAKFVREGKKRGLFENRMIINPVGAHPGYIRQLGQEAPVGWWSATGYPAQEIDAPKHKAFIEKYKQRFGELPSLGVVYGYTVLHLYAKAIEKAGNTNPNDVANAIRNLTFDGLQGKITFRAFDGASSQGTYIGQTGFVNDVPTIVNWHFVEPEPYLPTKEEIRTLRKEK